MATTKSRIEITAVDRTKGALSSVQRGLKGVGSALFSVQTLIGSVVGAAGLGALVKSSLAAGDALGKTADKLGTTTQALAGLRLQAQRTAGVSSGVLDTALQRLSRRSSEAAQGTGTLKKELEQLGIDVQKFSQLSVDQQFAQLGDAMEGVTNQGDRLRISMAAFDTEGAVLEATLSGGAEAAAGFAQEADDLGLALDRVEAAQLERAGDAMQSTADAVQGIGNQITIALAPALTVVSEQLTDLAKDSNFWGEATTNAVNGVITGMFRAAEVINGVGAAWDFLKLAAATAFNEIFGYLETFYTKLARAAEFVGMDTIADGARSVAEAMATLQLTTESSLVKVQEDLAEHVEFVGLLRETETAAIQMVADAAALSAETQVAANETVQASLEKVTTSYKKFSKEEVKAARDAAAAEKKAAANKIKAQEGFTSAAISLGNTLFQDNKAVRAGLIVADTAAAIMKALSIYGPTPLGWSQAAAAGAAGVAQLAAANGASKGGGSTAPVSGGGGGGSGGGSPSPVIPDSAASAGTSTNVNISLGGGLYSREEVQELIRAINNEIGEGAELVAV